MQCYIIFHSLRQYESLLSDSRVKCLDCLLSPPLSPVSFNQSQLWPLLSNVLYFIFLYFFFFEKKTLFSAIPLLPFHIFLSLPLQPFFLPSLSFLFASISLQYTVTVVNFLLFGKVHNEYLESIIKIKPFEISKRSSVQNIQTIIPNSYY